MLATQTATAPSALVTVQQLIAKNWQRSKLMSWFFKPEFLDGDALPHLELAEQDSILAELTQLAATATPEQAVALARQRIELLSAWQRYEEAIAACDIVLASQSAPHTSHILWLRGYNLFRQSAIAEALPWFMAALQLHPSDTGRTSIAGWAAQIEHYDEATALYEQLTQRQPNSPDHWFQLAHCYAMQQRNADALTANEQGLKHDPTSLIGLYNANIILRRLDRSGEAQIAATRAIPLYDEYLKTHADSGEIWSRYAGLLSDMTRDDDALAACARAEDLGALNAYRTHSNVLIHLRRYDEAIAVIDQALHTHEINDRWLLAALWSHKARALHFLQRDEEALTASDATLAVPPPTTYHRLTDIYRDRAMILAALTRADEAEATFLQALAITPDVSVFARYAWFLIKHDRYAEAVAAYEQAQAINANAFNFWDWINFGHALAHVKRYQEALVIMQQAQIIKITYQNTVNTGAVLWRLHREDEARAILMQGLELWEVENGLHPHDRRLMEYKPTILFYLGRYDEALAAITEGQQIFPDIDYAGILSALLLKQERYQEILMLQSSEPDANLLYNQSAAYRALGNTEQAQAKLVQTLAVDPEYPDAVADIAKYGDKQEES